nr:hypothetical protein [Bacillus sp. SD075]
MAPALVGVIAWQILIGAIIDHLGLFGCKKGGRHLLTFRVNTH